MRLILTTKMTRLILMISKNQKIDKNKLQKIFYRNELERSSRKEVGVV